MLGFRRGLEKAPELWHVQLALDAASVHVHAAARASGSVVCADWWITHLFGRAGGPGAWLVVFGMHEWMIGFQCNNICTDKLGFGGTRLDPKMYAVH